MSAALAPSREIAPPPVGTAADRAAAERRARADLRRQIAALERRLGRLFATSFPRQGIDWGIGATGGPRVLGIGELERVRDSLAMRLRDAQRELAERTAAEGEKRQLLERMIAEPKRHRWVIVSNDDIGERGCRHWHSRPRWGLLGMLFGWWRVKLSSGCPLAKGLRPPARRVTPSPMAKKRRKQRPRRPPPKPSPEAAQTPAPDPRAQSQAAKRRRAAAADERPPAPWGSFPLVELVVLVGLVLLVVGFFVGGSRGTTMVVTGLVLGSLAGLELSVREHFAGFRSHTALLAGVAAVLTMGISFYLLDLAAGIAIAAGIVVGALAALGLVRAFRARAGRAVKLR